MTNQITGKIGEDLATDYLTSRGYKLIEKNYRQKWGEIDIIVKSLSGILVFVEVKTLNGIPDSGLTPEDNITAFKMRQLKKCAEFYAAKHPELINEKSGWRIDVLAINITEDSPADIRHYENI